MVWLKQTPCCHSCSHQTDKDLHDTTQWHSLSAESCTLVSCKIIWPREWRMVQSCWMLLKQLRMIKCIWSDVVWYIRSNLDTKIRHCSEVVRSQTRQLELNSLRQKNIKKSGAFCRKALLVHDFSFVLVNLCMAAGQPLIADIDLRRSKCDLGKVLARKKMHLTYLEICCDLCHLRSIWYWGHILELLIDYQVCRRNKNRPRTKPWRYFVLQ